MLLFCFPEPIETSKPLLFLHLLNLIFPLPTQRTRRTKIYLYIPTFFISCPMQNLIDIFLGGEMSESRRFSRSRSANLSLMEIKPFRNGDSRFLFVLTLVYAMLSLSFKKSHAIDPGTSASPKGEVLRLSMMPPAASLIIIMRDLI